MKLNTFTRKHKSTRFFILRCQRQTVLLLVLVSLICAPKFLYSKDLVTHYIIAFDQSIGNYKASYASPNTLSILNRILIESDFDRERDYISIVGYSMPLGNPSMDDFVRPYFDKNGHPIIWNSIAGASLSEYFPMWPKGQPVLDAGKAPFGSMQSLAKPYIVMATHNQDGNVENADKTMLLIVSDEVINGTDDNYTQEWNHVSVTPGSNTAKFRTLSADVFKTMNNFNEEFKFVQTPMIYNGQAQSRIPLTPDGNYKIIPYEVIPAEMPSIHSVTDMPSPLPLKRVRGGYRLNAEVGSINPKYTINEIKITRSDGEVIGESKEGLIDVTIPSNAINEGDTMHVSMTLLLKDGMYNGSRISERNERYKTGMTLNQVVKRQEDAKIFGFIPLVDWLWWWYPNDAFKAVIIWDLFLVLILLVIALFLGYRWLKQAATYVPSDESVKITHL